jgi:hypothetical protein
MFHSQSARFPRESLCREFMSAPERNNESAGELCQANQTVTDQWKYNLCMPPFRALRRDGRVRCRLNCRHQQSSTGPALIPGHEISQPLSEEIWPFKRPMLYSLMRYRRRRSSGAVDPGRKHSNDPSRVWFAELTQVGSSPSIPIAEARDIQGQPHCPS